MINYQFLSDSLYIWVNKFNQIVSILNNLTDGNSAVNGTITLKNTNRHNNNVTVNVASGMIAGDGGLLSNLQTSAITSKIQNNQLQNSIITITSADSSITVTGGIAQLSNTVYMNTNFIVSNSITDISTSNIASPAAINIVYNIGQNYGNAIPYIAASAIASVNTSKIIFPTINNVFTTVNISYNNLLQKYALVNTTIGNIINTTSNIISNIYTQINTTAQFVNATAFSQINTAFSLANSTTILLENSIITLGTSESGNGILEIANTIEMKGVFSYGSLINFSTSVAPDIINAYNVANTTGPSGNGYVHVDFVTLSKNSNYIVMAQLNQLGWTGLNDIFININNKSSYGFDIYLIDSSGNYNAANADIDFIVLGAIPAIGGLVVPGSQTYTVPGTYYFSIPLYNTLTTTVLGSGGGGGGESDILQQAQNGFDGTSSSFNGNIIGYGGGGGGGAYGFYQTGIAGNNGGWAGGDSFVIGAPGGNGGVASGVAGHHSSGRDGGPGGGGGGTIKTYSNGDLVTGNVITIIVGARGSGGYGEPERIDNYPTANGSFGSNGSITITWS